MSGDSHTADCDGKIVEPLLNPCWLEPWIWVITPLAFSRCPLIKTITYNTLWLNYFHSNLHKISFSLCLNRANSWIITQISVSFLSLRVKAGILSLQQLKILHKFYNFTMSLNSMMITLSLSQFFIWWALVSFCLYVSKHKTCELIQSSKAVIFYWEKPDIHKLIKF